MNESKIAHAALAFIKAEVASLDARDGPLNGRSMDAANSDALVASVHAHACLLELYAACEVEPPPQVADKPDPFRGKRADFRCPTCRRDRTVEALGQYDRAKRLGVCTQCATRILREPEVAHTRLAALRAAAADRACAASVA